MAIFALKSVSGSVTNGLAFGKNCSNICRATHILSATKMQPRERTFWQYKVYAGIRGSRGFAAQGSSNDEIGVVENGDFRFIRSLSSNIFTVRRYALHGLSYRNSARLSVRPSVCPSVRHTRGLCPHGSTYDHNFFTIW